MSKEGRDKTKPIAIPEKEVEIWRNRLCDWFSKEKNARDPLIKANYIINKALAGWGTAPMSFEKRIELLIGLNSRQENYGKWSNSYAYKKYEDAINDVYEVEKLKQITLNTKKEKEVIVRDLSDKEKDLLDDAKKREKLLNDIDKCNIPGMTKGGYIGAGIYQILNIKELEYWLEREKIYRQEFELNSSSDEPLLKQVLMEELIQDRIIRQRIENPDKVMQTEDVMQNSYSRLQKALEALNATRKQRESESVGNKGNIAQLSLVYEEKVKNIEELLKKQKEEETEMMKKRESRIPCNIIDDNEELIDGILEIQNENK